MKKMYMRKTERKDIRRTIRKQNGRGRKEKINRNSKRLKRNLKRREECGKSKTE